MHLTFIRKLLTALRKRLILIQTKHTCIKVYSVKPLYRDPNIQLDNLS